MTSGQGNSVEGQIEVLQKLPGKAEYSRMSCCLRYLTVAGEGESVYNTMSFTFHCFVHFPTSLAAQSCVTVLGKDEMHSKQKCTSEVATAERWGFSFPPRRSDLLQSCRLQLVASSVGNPRGKGGDNGGKAHIPDYMYIIYLCANNIHDIIQFLDM